MPRTFDQAHEAFVTNSAIRRNARFEDFRELLAAGESPTVAAMRVGSNPIALCRQAYRWGALDIGRALNSQTLKMRRAS